MTPESNDRTDDPAATEGTSSEYLVYAQVAEAVDVCIREGHAPDVDALVAEHPEQAAHIRELVPTLVTLHDLGHEAKVVQDRTSASDSSAGAARQLGDYRIIREIGRGGMGVVYEAEQVSLGRRVALKVLPFAAVLDQRQLQRFKNEAQAAAQLHHTNIVPVFAVGCERGVHYYAMQYIEGQTLAAAIAELRQIAGVAGTPRGSATSSASSNVRLVDTPLTAPGSSGPLSAICSDGSTQSAAFFHAVANLGVDAAEALEHAHELGIVHRDIKPSNLLLDPRGKVWITDFGLAEVQSNPGLTMTGDIVGTLRYMSPDQALGQRVPLDHRTDIYSLGVTLYELLTLEPVYEGHDRQELLRKIANDDPRMPRQINKAIPRDLETIILRSIGRAPEERYATAGDLSEDLQRYLEDKPIKAKRPTVLERATKWSRRHRPVVLSAAVVLVVAVVALSVSTILILRQRDEAQAQRERAETNFQHALDAVEAMLTQVAQEELAHVPQMEQVRQALLERALGFYERFLDQNDTDPTIRHETGRAYGRVGDIRKMLGQHEQAEEAYRQAIALLEELSAEFPNHPEHHLELARALSSLGAMLRLRGEHQEAETAYRQALSLLKELTADYPNVAEHQRELARTQHELGTLLWYASRHQEAARAYQQATDIYEKLVADSPTVPQYMAGLAKTQAHLGGLLQIFGKLQEAEAALHRALGLWEQLSGQVPQEPDYRRQLAYTQTVLGHLLMNTGRPQEAASVRRRAVNMSEKLVTEFPSVPRYRTGLAGHYHNLAMTLRNSGPSREAEQLLRQAITLRANLVADFPQVPRYLLDLANSHHKLGVVLGQLSLLKEKEEAYRQALAFSEKLAEDFPMVPEYVLNLASSHYNLGSVLGSAGRLHEAEQAYRKSQAIYEKLPPDFPTVAEHSEALARNARNLGSILLDTGRLDEAEQACRRTLILSERTRDDYSNWGHFKRDVALAHEYLGDIWVRTGRPQGAEEAYREALSLSENLVEEFPDNDLYRIAVGIITRKLAVLYSASDRNAQALDTFQEAVVLHQGALNDFPEVAFVRYNLAACQNSMAWFLLTCQEKRVRDPARAAELMEKAIGLAPEEATFWHTLGVAHYRAGKLGDATEALQHSIELKKGGDSFDWFFLAMVHWQLGNREEAQEWLDRAAEWMEQNRPNDEELRRFRAEAEDLLGVVPQQIPEAVEPPSERE